MTILVTGAAGLLGRHVVRTLLDRGHAVAAVYRSAQNGLESERRLSSLDRCDLTNRDAVRGLLQRMKPAAVVHAAARIAPDAPPGTHLEDNVLATANLVNEAMRAGCGRFVFCSSISVYSGVAPESGGYSEQQALSPVGDYAASKLIGEDIVRMSAARSFQGCSLRLAGLHGAHRTTGVVYSMLNAARRGAPLRIENSDCRFRLLFLPDAAEAVALAAERELPSQYCCHNVASRDIYDLPTLAKAVLRTTGSASAIDLIGGQKADHQVMNIERIGSELSYAPRDLSQGLAETWTWLQSAAVRQTA